MPVIPELTFFAWIAGSIAGCLSVIAFVPQAWRIYSRRSAKDVSLAMYVVMIGASLLWMFYAFVYDAVALFLTNLVIALIALVIVGLKIRYGSR